MRGLKTCQGKEIAEVKRRWEGGGHAEWSREQTGSLVGVCASEVTSACAAGRPVVVTGFGVGL